MKTLALRLYGKGDLRLEEYELPAIQDDEILASVVSNSICMSSHKAAKQGADHKRVPNDVDQNPKIIGHEFAGTILEVGNKCDAKFSPGQKYSIQPAICYPGREQYSLGYSFPDIGGNATNVIVPAEALEMGCLLPYEGEGFFNASLAEPLSCVIGAQNTQYHFKHGQYHHEMGIVEGGKMAILAGAGPMGLGSVDYVLHASKKPRMLVVTDIDQDRLDRAMSMLTVEHAAEHGVDLHYINTSTGDPVRVLKNLAGVGFDDVFVYAPVGSIIEQASGIMGLNGCLNFFAGPEGIDFSASMNFYDIHYSDHHVVGSSGGNTDDMREALELIGKGHLNPAVMVTHIGGLDCAAKTIMDLPSIPGGKKLIYTNISMPLTALVDFAAKGETDPLFAKLARITEEHNGLWSTQAEKYLLEYLSG